MFFLAKNIRKIGTWLHMRRRRTVANLTEFFFPVRLDRLIWDWMLLGLNFSCEVLYHDVTILMVTKESQLTPISYENSLI